jgi:hydrogenase expression/formation protein HypC
MCLGIPGRIISISDAERKLAMVEVGGVQREVNVACVIDDAMPVWVLVHVGFAMSRIDEAEAAATLRTLSELGEVQQELAAMAGTA